jgi:glycosyltransferase involved in cell wall biosynthesis
MKLVNKIFALLFLLHVSAHAAIDDKTFVIIISSHNNENFCEQNLASVFNQTYPHYRVIYIDDCSSDNTVKKVESCVLQNHQKERFTLVKNSERKGVTENYYRIINTCNDEEIVVLINGEDWLSDNRVLEYLNRYYSQADIWMTYGSYFDYPAMKRGELSHKVPYKVLKNGSIRAYLSKGWVLSPLQTFYAKLFKKIKLQDVLYQGAFLQSRADQAIMIPMTEMAGKHSLFIEDAVYVHNTTNPLSEEKINLEKRGECMRYLLTLSPYKNIMPSLLNDNRKSRTLTADLVIFSYDRPLQLYACLESIQRYMTGLGKITVIYRTSDKSYAQGYLELQGKFKHINFVAQSANYQKDFKPMLLSAVYGYSAEHVFFAFDDLVVKDAVNIPECVEAMEKTGAHGFYLSLGKDIDYCHKLHCKQQVPESISLGNEIYAWQFLTGSNDWAVPNSLSMTLFRKSEIHKDLADMPYTSPSSLEYYWKETADMRAVGLFYPESKVVNIPLNNVQSPSPKAGVELYTTAELQALFKNGMKMDISPLFRIKNHSIHVEFEPSFKKR